MNVLIVKKKEACVYTHTHTPSPPSPQKKNAVRSRILKACVSEKSPTATEQRSTPLPLPPGMLITWFQFPSFPCQVMIIFSASQHTGID